MRRLLIKHGRRRLFSSSLCLLLSAFLSSSLFLPLRLVLPQFVHREDVVDGARRRTGTQYGHRSSLLRLRNGINQFQSELLLFPSFGKDLLSTLQFVFHKVSLLIATKNWSNNMTIMEEKQSVENHHHPSRLGRSMEKQQSFRGVATVENQKRGVIMEKLPSFGKAATMERQKSFRGGFLEKQKTCGDGEAAELHRKLSSHVVANSYSSYSRSSVASELRHSDGLELAWTLAPRFQSVAICRLLWFSYRLSSLAMNK
ncbi:hypothetical protein DY000_02025945 [Brassica cretica]|uniref:DUF4005 domain-containing protein n=1 Tax=Brassica cretica TaxID=69181 RepID=A0ABQ7EHG0_BRACR|nr:hypothetical protein DY000_02025945 [Brassica cretica]